MAKGTGWDATWPGLADLVCSDVSLCRCLGGATRDSFFQGGPEQCWLDHKSKQFFRLQCLNKFYYHAAYLIHWSRSGVPLSFIGGRTSLPSATDCWCPMVSHFPSVGDPFDFVFQTL